MPKATVLMPVYNAGAYLKEAINSVLDQTFDAYRLLIINDGSTDNSEAIILSFNDHRIVYHKHDTNKGLIATLNEGLSLAQGEYIIRMDADDISVAGRFEKQIAFMDANPQIGIAGSWFSELESGNIVRHPVSSGECKVMLLHNTVLGHPTVIMRRELLSAHQLKYDKTALYTEDYKLWTDAVISGLKLANIPEVLLQYRGHHSQVSASNAHKQNENAHAIKLLYVQHYFGDLLHDRLNIYIELVTHTINSFVAFTEAKKLVKQLKTVNQLKSYFDTGIFACFFDDMLKNAATRIYVMCVDCNMSILGKAIFDRHFYTHTSVFQKTKFAFRSLQNTLT